MDLTEKIEKEVQIKASADQFFKIFSTQAHHIPNICSEHIHEIAVHEGDWETPGSIKKWNYTIDGKTMSVKESVEIDEANKKVIFNILEGDLMEHHKSLKSTVEAIAKDDGGALVKWSLEYEKMHADVPSLHSYLDLLEKMTKDIDNHLLKP
ncbi:MLP-like protein 28 [Mercurialis annua]|uniref:MLP-like protein 28 n=1 Tax=Mercurialis annua TaxID=3986 RepID=UPI002160E426|nr:MLP-like protein 28 [Mercurialis annua]